MAKKIPSHIQGFLDYMENPNEDADNDLLATYFRKLHSRNFKRESQAKNADGYVEGKFVAEFKTSKKDIFSGLIQGFSYKRWLDFSFIIVVTKGFVGLWSKDSIPEKLRAEILTSKKAPNSLGKDLAKKYKKLASEIISSCSWCMEYEPDTFFKLEDDIVIEEFKKFEGIIEKQEIVRSKITLSNFTTKLKQLADFFDQDNPIKAVRAFYSMIHGWDKTSILELSEKYKTKATLKGELITDILPDKRLKLKEFVESHYIYVDSTQNKDEFFARYDEAIDSVDRDFRRKNGIFFTDLNLSRLAMWHVRQELGNIGKNHLVLDPACGSGNLVTNWKSPLELRHKVVSEIEPELLFTVEKRMKLDSWHNGKFTVVPKVEENLGLNFIDKSADEYISILKKYLVKKGEKPNKPIAIICNPPYRNDYDQDVSSIDYKIHESIVEVTGHDASLERLNCFLAQMKLVAESAEDSGLPGQTLVMLFSSVSWLTNREVSKTLRKNFLEDFEDISGFMINSKEFFDLSSSFPIAFSIWRYRKTDKKLDGLRTIPLKDLTWLKKSQLEDVNWNDIQEVNKKCLQIFSNKEVVDVSYGMDSVPIRYWVGLSRYDFMRGRRKDEKGSKKASGLPLGDRRHENKKAYGENDGEYLGVLDDLTPCRINKDVGNAPWFRLDSIFYDCNKSRCLSAPPDQKGYTPYDDESRKKIFFWYSLMATFKTVGYPMWANILNLWGIPLKYVDKKRISKITHAIVFADNNCTEFYFPANNPVKGAKELYRSNPLTPNDPNSYWMTEMASLFDTDSNDLPTKLVNCTLEIFKKWKSIVVKNNGEIFVDYDRAYFIGEKKLNLGAGLIQIKDYAKEVENQELLTLFETQFEILKSLRVQFYEELFNEKGVFYFGRRLEEEPFKYKIQNEIPIQAQKRIALSTLILDELQNDKELGRTKLAKVYYLVEQLREEKIENTYYREAAGPLSYELLYHPKYSILEIGEKYNIFTQSKVKKGKLTKYKFLPGKNFNKAVNRAKSLYKDDFRKIRKLCSIVESLTSFETEAVATLFACWNDLLISGKNVTDEEIFNEFYNNWSDDKKKFSLNKLSEMLNLMRGNRLTPKGSGEKTKKLPSKYKLVS